MARRGLVRLLGSVVLGWLLLGCSANSLLLTADPPLSHTTLVFEDEFDGDTLDAEKWDSTWWVGPIFHSDLAWFSDDALSVSGGTLKITASERPSVNQWDPEDVRQLSTGQVSSVELFERGTFEIRMRHQAGANLVQALWLLPYPYAWPPEIDIMETRLSVDPKTVYLHVHAGTEENPTSEPTYIELPESLDGEWHVYRLVWEGAVIAWYIDKELVRSQVTEVSGVPMRLLLDQTWILPWSGGRPILEELPVVMEIDYVRIWQ